MFGWNEPKYERCSDLIIHPRHRWYPHWWSKTRICLGRDKDPWVRANPSLGVGVSEKKLREFYEEHLYFPHKHSLKLTGWGGKINRPRHDINETLYFTCKSGCKDPLGYTWQIDMPRWRYNQMVLKQKPFDQTWPG